MRSYDLAPDPEYKVTYGLTREDDLRIEALRQAVSFLSRLETATPGQVFDAARRFNAFLTGQDKNE